MADSKSATNIRRGKGLDMPELLLQTADISQHLRIHDTVSMFLGNVAVCQIMRCHNPQSYNIHFHPFENTDSIRMHKSKGDEYLWFSRNVTKKFSRLLIHEPPGGDCRKQYVVMKQPKYTVHMLRSVV
jgi:hypothetical protein